MSMLPMTPSEIAKGEAWNAEARALASKNDAKLAEHEQLLSSIEATYNFLPVWHGCRDHATNHCEECASCDCFEMPYECPDCGDDHDGTVTGTEYCPGCEVDRENAKYDAEDGE